MHGKFYDFGAIILGVLVTITVIDYANRYFSEQEEEKKVHYVCVETLGDDGELMQRECTFK